MKTLSEWLDYLYSLHPNDIDLGLTRITNVAKSLNVTTFACPVITVAGTNGKGSVVKCLESIYLAAGYRVAAYTSPHLLHFNERLRLSGEPVTDQQLMAAFAVIDQHRGSYRLSFFEFTTMAVLLICQQQELDMLLLEVGLGGRLDAVNIVDSTVAVISNIAIDHTHYLGADREKIGREKAGIMRVRAPVVCGDPDPPASVCWQAKQLQAPFYQFQRDFKFECEGSHWQWQGPNVSYLRLPMPALKLQNAASSVMTIELLQKRLPVTQFAVIRGLRGAHLPGRFEQCQLPQAVIFDVAHNPQAAGYLAEQLQTRPINGRTLAVVAMLADKDIAGTLQPMLSVVDHWYVASLTDVVRGEKGTKLAAALATQGVECYNFASVVAAAVAALADCRENDRIVVFGSFHTVAIVKQHQLQEVV